MVRLLAEQPTLLAIMLAILGGGCVYGWLQTGKRPAAVIGLICFALIPAGYLLAANWETDRERLTTLVHSTAAAVEANDVDGVLAFIDPAQPEIRERAASEMPKYTFTRTEIGQVRSIKFVQNAVPPEAQVDLTVNFTGGLQSGEFAGQNASRRVVLRCRKQNDRWYISDYTHLPVIGGPDGFTPNSELTRSYRAP
ncbi:hypothetical protein [Roseimaritima ulvae]|uniref:DUF4440 domain-containing protein n=1 Tax=Roseimaritima ulvae TaxID=980254 RepID=A0A5B9QRK0_9BACT|nr:hypothetical protein [Roseimaritima ulvae]QEG41658.1 hypothetical protein UC8_36840 [Roseimaritima ulvae]